MKKSEKIGQLVKLTKEIGQKLQDEWNVLDSTSAFQNHIIAPGRGSLSTAQKTAYNKVVDEFAGKTPVEIFEMLFNPEIRQLIVDETNRYARGQHNDIFYNLNDESLKCFIGVLLYSGYHTPPRQRMYWEADRDLWSDIVRDSLSRSDFEKIKKYLHLADNDNLRPVKFAKVLPLYDAANRSLKQFGFLHSSLSIDEQMIPYFGLHSAKQTM